MVPINGGKILLLRAKRIIIALPAPPSAIPMTTVGLSEAKHRWSELVERAARGEQIVITRRGEAVARLMPLAVRNAQAQAHAVAARIRRSRARRPLGDAASIREMVEEGRP